MTIIEALKSGKPYRRADNPWITPSEIKSHVYLTGIDILADDWEVKEEDMIEQLRYKYEKLLIEFQDAERKAYEAGHMNTSLSCITYEEWMRQR